MSSHSERTPLLTFGVTSDVQYADVDDLPAEYDPRQIRFYRKSHIHIEKAFKFWECYEYPVRFTLQLGDIIDGLSVKYGNSHTAMKNTLSRYECHSSIPTFHTVGNHELYNFRKPELSEIFRKSMAKMCVEPQILSTWGPVECSSSNPDDCKFYYKFCPGKFLKFISLDCFEISVLGYDSDHPKYKEAAKILEHYHKHNIYEDWDGPGHLKGPDSRFQQMNGAVGKEQLEWLEEELADSDRNREMVIVFGHVNLSPESADYSCLLWNYEEVVACFHRHHCVIAYLSGHSHKAGKNVDEHGIHYVVFPSAVETPLDSPGFATVSVYPHQLKVTGSETYCLALDQNHHHHQSFNVSSSEILFKSSNETIKVNV